MNTFFNFTKSRTTWNKGKLVGQKSPLKLKEIWAIRIRLQLNRDIRDLALFNIAIDSKLRGCDLLKLRVGDVSQGGTISHRATIIQQKTNQTVQFEITPRSMAESLGRSASTVSREISRNGGCSEYRAAQADQNAWDRSRRAKQCKLACNRLLRYKVERKLKLNWSPTQIAGWLKRHHPEDESYHVSHETIYRSLFVQARGVLKKELMKHLRSKRTIRRSKQSSLKQEGLGQITNMVSIRERPASVEDRAVPGHWEGDLICGSNNSYIATLVERHSRYVMLAKVNNRDTQTVISALIKHAHKLPRELYKSLTWDQGKEMADHQRFTLATDIDVYFCDPKSPWQRGSNENTNGLLRQYFPK